MTQDIDKELLFAGIMAVHRLLGGDASVRQTRIGAGRQIALTKKQPVRRGTDALACLLGAAEPLRVDDAHPSLRSYLAVRLYGARRMCVKSGHRNRDRAGDRQILV